MQHKVNMGSLDYAVIHTLFFKAHNTHASRVKELVNLMVSGLEKQAEP